MVMGRPSATDFRKLEEGLGYTFRNVSLLEAALTHASALPAGVIRESERLEFLGDAVIDLVIADLLVEAFPDLAEGQLSKSRATLVRTSMLAAKARGLGLGDFVRLGRGEDLSGGRNKDSILAAAYEAVVGAILRDASFDRVKAVVADHFRAELGGGQPPGEQDWKTLLQEHTQARLRTVPEYRLTEECGPAHARQFTSEVWVAGQCLARGEGSSKRQAEQQAARGALEALPDTDRENAS